jgi:hypothetical protein
MNLTQKLEEIKNREVTSYGAPIHNFKSGDIVLINGVQQSKNGRDKTILSGRKAIVVEISKKPTLVRAILIDNNEKLQNCIIPLPVSDIIKIEDEKLYNKFNAK